MKHIMALTAAFSFVLGLYGYAAAHGGAHKMLMGTIHVVIESEMVMITPDGEYVPVALRSSTRYVTTRDEKGNWGELRDGMRVVVKLNVQGKSADEVRYRRGPKGAEQEGAGDDESK
jgi:hypothetical protein